MTVADAADIRRGTERSLARGIGLLWVAQLGPWLPKAVDVVRAPSAAGVVALGSYAGYVLL